MPTHVPETTAAMPIKTVDIKLDEIGYPGWQAAMRLNVRASVYDDFLSQDREAFWSAFGQVVVAWNFRTEEGQPMPLPRDGLGLKDLPYDILNTLTLRYVEAQLASAAVPKAADVSSETSSRINGAAPFGASA
jgi:hypothetical protein